MILILMENKEFDAALRWLDMWKDVEPDDSRLKKLSILERYRAIGKRVRVPWGRRRKSDSLKTEK